MKNTDETRRRFMAHFAGAGLGATLVPGILRARMQDSGAQKINLAMVTDALKMAARSACGRPQVYIRIT